MCEEAQAPVQCCIGGYGVLAFVLTPFLDAFIIRLRSDVSVDAAEMLLFFA